MRRLMISAPGGPRNVGDYIVQSRRVTVVSRNNDELLTKNAINIIKNLNHVELKGLVFLIISVLGCLEVSIGSW